MVYHARTRITGTGSYLPPRIVPNSELAGRLETSDEWIQEKIGIQERRFVGDGVGCVELALEASQKALASAKRKPTDVDAILFATSTPDYQAPGSGVLLQDKLGCHKIPAFDLRNTSPGFLFALELGDTLIRCGKYSCLLVVASEVHSTGLDMSPRGRLMSVIFGDGAGAVVLEPTEGPHGILSTRLHSDGKFFDKLWCEAPSSRAQPRISRSMIDEGKIYPTMDGRVVFKEAVKLMSLAAQEILIEQNLTVQDLAFVIPHQANLRIIEALADQLKIPMKQVCQTIQKFGNTNAASIPITLDLAARASTFKAGDKLLLTSFGSGFSWGSALLSW